MIAWLLRAHHVPDLPREGRPAFHGPRSRVVRAAFVWLSYVALEPHVRRRWPDLLISWNRLLTGRLRDPLVGRDVLVGALLGATNAMLLHFSNALPAWIDAPGMTPVPPSELMMRGTREAASFFVVRQNDAVFAAVGMMFLFFLASSIFRRRKWLGAVPLGFLFVLLNVSGENLAIEIPFAVLIATILVFVVLRFGLLAVAVAGVVGTLLTALSDHPRLLAVVRGAVPVRARGRRGDCCLRLSGCTRQTPSFRSGRSGGLTATTGTRTTA